MLQCLFVFFCIHIQIFCLHIPVIRFSLFLGLNAFVWFFALFCFSMCWFSFFSHIYQKIKYILQCSLFSEFKKKPQIDAEWNIDNKAFKRNNNFRSVLPNVRTKKFILKRLFTHIWHKIVKMNLDHCFFFFWYSRFLKKLSNGSNLHSIYINGNSVDFHLFNSIQLSLISKCSHFNAYQYFDFLIYTKHIEFNICNFLVRQFYTFFFRHMMDHNVYY